MKIRISDSQLDGAIVIIFITVIMYVFAYSSFLQAPKVYNLLYREKGHEQIIVGITVDKGSQNIYWLPSNAKVCDLLKSAGIGNLADLDERILHTQLSAGSVVFIESNNQIKIGEMMNVSKIALNIPIDINEATFEDLMLIPGIGEKTALQIIQYREKSGNFRRPEDIMKIRGIKEKKFAKLKKYFTIGQVSS